MIRGMVVLAMALATAVALVGCGTVSPDTRAAASGPGPGPGWRKGLVVQAGDRDSLGPPIDGDCREEARRGDVARRYVEIQYFVGRHAHVRIVPLDDALDVAAGDAVWFRSFGCSSARKVPAAT